MHYTKHLVLLLLALSFGLLACNNGDDDDNSVNPDRTDDIAELAIRMVKPGMQAEFEAARDALVAKLVQEEGVFNDREYASFLTFTPRDTSRAVFIGMTQYEDLATFQATAQKLGGFPEAAAFFQTFDMLHFTGLKPLEEGTEVDLSKLATGGQILEIAVRDISKYANFDQADYEAKRDAFLALLAQQEGRVAEYQWVSALDPNIVVGMTVYADQAAFSRILSNPDFAGSEAVTNFLGSYPPNVAAEYNVVVK